MTNPAIGTDARYEFTYQTPTLQSDGQGGQTTVNIPTTFALSAIALDVARGILRGLGTVPTITSPVCNRVRDASDTLTGGSLI